MTSRAIRSCCSVIALHAPLPRLFHVPLVFCSFRDELGSLNEKKQNETNRNSKTKSDATRFELRSHVSISRRSCIISISQFLLALYESVQVHRMYTHDIYMYIMYIYIVSQLGNERDHRPSWRLTTCLTAGERTRIRSRRSGNALHSRRVYLIYLKLARCT